MPVVHPHMTVSDVIHSLPKVCNFEMVENLVVQEDIPLIEILAINQSNRDNKYSWSYTKSGLYTVKSCYWVARNILRQEPEVMVS